MEKTVLIMAGGHGTRFWPKSRKSLPKQFLALLEEDKSMIQLTVERLLPLVPIEHIYISTNQDYQDLVQEQLPSLPKDNIIVEPIGRNTAPCIGLGAIHIQKKYGDAIMIILPSDHEILHPDQFLDAIKDICAVSSQEENLTTIGITPTYAEPGYGYIKYLPDTYDGKVYKVDTFVEKPDSKTAEMYVQSGQYLWNAGQFAFKASTILNKMKEFMPDTYERLLHIQQHIGKEDYTQVLTEEFTAMESQSIDYGVLEKADHIYVKPGTYGWDDVGSWLALERLQTKDENGNVLKGNVQAEHTTNTIVQAGNRLVALVGVDDLIVVDTEDITLICKKEKGEEIKELYQKLKEEYI